MPNSLTNQLVVAISSRALFNFEEENRVFEDPDGGEEKYIALQCGKLDEPAPPGVGFHLCRKLLAFNSDDAKLTEVVVLSRNDPYSGMRVFNSAKHHGLAITRGVFMAGGNPFPYLRPLTASLFLSADPGDVRRALKMGVPAARVSPRESGGDPNEKELRIAFDGDSVLFDDGAEKVFKEHGLASFMAHEESHAKDPLGAGPLAPFLVALNKVRSKLTGDQRITVALVTARGAPAHERALRTLKSWGVIVDQAFFLDGLPKTPFLTEFRPDFFFDDQLSHVEPASGLVSAGHVLYGVANEPESLGQVAGA